MNIEHPKFCLDDNVKLTDGYVKDVMGIADFCNEFTINNIYTKGHSYTVWCARENTEIPPNAKYMMLNFGVRKLYELKHKNSDLYYTVEENIENLN